MKRNLLLAAASVLVALGLVEITLRTFTRFPVTERSNRREHDRLMYTLDPFLADVNREGFRNPESYRGEDIVAIGDSHTYGTNVSPSKSWPEQLEQRLQRGVYNMGVPSYHLYSYVYLAETMLRAQPDRILVTLYPGNDLTFYVCRTLNLKYWRRRFRRHPRLTRRACPRRDRPDEGTTSWKQWVRRTAVGDLLDLTVWDPYVLPALLDLRETLAGWWSERSRSYVHLKRHGTAIRVPRIAFFRRWRGVNRDRDLVSESLENARILLDKLARRARKHGVGIQFLLIPSRERILYEWARDPGRKLPAIAARAAREEARLTETLKIMLRKRCFPTADVTEDLLARFDRSVREGNPLFPRGDDHPDARGYEVYAEHAERLVNGPGRIKGCSTGSGTSNPGTGEDLTAGAR